MKKCKKNCKYIAKSEAWGVLGCRGSWACSARDEDMTLGDCKRSPGRPPGQVWICVLKSTGWRQGRAQTSLEVVLVALVRGTAPPGCQQPSWDCSARELVEPQLIMAKDGEQRQAAEMQGARVRGSGLPADSSLLPELLDRRQNVISCSFHSKAAVKV